MTRPSPRISFWEGDERQLGPGVRLLRLGGHFPGSSVLLWETARDGEGVLFTGGLAERRRGILLLDCFPAVLPQRASPACFFLFATTCAVVLRCPACRRYRLSRAQRRGLFHVQLSKSAAAAGRAGVHQLVRLCSVCCSSRGSAHCARATGRVCLENVSLH